MRLPLFGAADTREEAKSVLSHCRQPDSFGQSGSMLPDFVLPSNRVAGAGLSRPLRRFDFRVLIVPN